MTRLKVLALVATAVPLVAFSPAAANHILNPGFELDAVLDSPPSPFITEWSGFNGANQASANLDPVHSGIGSLQLASGGGGFSVPGANQVLPASPGQLWDLQGFLFSKETLPANTTFGVLKIVFSDGTADLEPASINIGSADAQPFPGIVSSQLNASSPANSWQFRQAQGVAPVGTTQVKFYALLVDQSPWTIYADDLQATLAGDFDSDFDIDGDDLTIWKGAAPQSSDADADGDHDSDGVDFLLWQRYFNPPTVAAAAVPEPASALLLAAGMALLGRRRRPKFAE